MTVLRRSERLYGFLLKFYPERYRQEFGEEMMFVFSESLKDAYAEHGDPGVVDLWVRTAVDAGRSLVTQHVDNLKRGDSMKTKNTNVLTRNRDILILALVVALILMVPLAGMQFDDEMNWSLFDFVTAGALLFGTGLAFVLMARRSGNLAYRAGMGLALTAGLMLLWINLAVGIIGSEDNPANWMYVGVLAVGLIGAVLARFRAGGMVRAMFATALAQALVTVIALIVMPHGTSPDALWDVLVVLGVDAFFIALWVGSALLFRRASDASPESAA
jgi:hypothetical protein